MHEQRGYCNGGTGFDNNFKPVPNQPHGGNDFRFTDCQDILDVFADNLESERAERGLQAIGDGVRVGGDNPSGIN